MNPVLCLILIWKPLSKTPRDMMTNNAVVFIYSNYHAVRPISQNCFHFFASLYAMFVRPIVGLFHVIKFKNWAFRMYQNVQKDAKKKIFFGMIMDFASIIQTNRCNRFTETTVLWISYLPLCIVLRGCIE